MARIGIDLDGVCYDFGGSLRAFLAGCHDNGICTRGGTACEQALKDYPEATRWEFYEDWGLTLGQFLDACDRGVDAGVVFRWGEPYPGTAEALRRLTDAGHTLHVITDRSFGAPGASELATHKWLDEHFPDIDFASVRFTADKTAVPVDFMIDDKLENYDALFDAGVAVFLLDRPWNGQGETLDDRYRVESLGEFVDIVLQQTTVLSPENFEKFASEIAGGEVRVVSETGGEKGSKPARYDLIPAGPLREVAELYGKGAAKYAPRNWERGYDWSLSFAALQRHAWQFWAGEDTDAETGAHHMASVVFHALALIEFGKTHPDFDNRPTSVEESAA